MEVGDEQKSEEMDKKLSQCWYTSDDGLSYLVSLLSWRWKMSRKVMEWFKSYPSAGRLVKMDFRTFSIFLYREWG